MFEKTKFTWREWDVPEFNERGLSKGALFIQRGPETAYNNKKTKTKRGAARVLAVATSRFKHVENFIVCAGLSS